MSRFTNPRRWSALSRRAKVKPLTENTITPDEARTALQSIVVQLGHVLERVYDYDWRKDQFRAASRDSDGKLHDLTIPGETIAKIVKAARTMCGGPHPMIRPSEYIERHAKAQ